MMLIKYASKNWCVYLDEEYIKSVNKVPACWAETAMPNYVALWSENDLPLRYTVLGLTLIARSSLSLKSSYFHCPPMESKKHLV